MESQVDKVTQIASCELTQANDQVSLKQRTSSCLIAKDLAHTPAAGRLFNTLKVSLILFKGTLL